MSDYYSTEQIAKLLGIKNVITVRRWISKKLLPAIKLDKEYRVAKADLEKFLEERKTTKGGNK